ncbi:MAG: hypothetical protein QXK96_03325 [Candidatus Bathyarchaeia archaeon]
MSSTSQNERIKDLINRLDHAYARGFMSPQEHRTLRRGLELRLAPAKRPVKKRRYFKVKLVMISIIAIMVLATIPLYLRSATRPEFEITDVRLEKDTISFLLRNKGSADAHNVEVVLLQSDITKPKILLARVDTLTPQDSVTVTKALEAGSGAQLYSARFNIVVSSREGVTLHHPFP